MPPKQPNQDNKPASSGVEPVFTSRPLEQPILGRDVLSKLQQGELGERLPDNQSFYGANKWYIWAIVVGAGLISVLSYFAFRTPPAPKLQEAKIGITIDAPETVASGGEMIYKVKIENQDSQKLLQQELELTYPAGFTYISSSPKAQNLSGTLFKVPDLVPGQNVVVIVKAKATGNVNDQKELKAKIRYRLDNFNSEFVKEQQFSVRLIAAQISLEINGPAETSSAQLVSYDITYKNNSQEKVQNARVKVLIPEGFSFASSQPEPDLSNNIWNVPSLEPGAEGKITLQGSYMGAGQGEGKTLLAEFLILSENGDYFTQNSASIITMLSSLPLMVSQELEGANRDVIEPGDSLTFRVRYQNNASTEARGVTISVVLDSKALDMGSISSEGGLVNNNTITWNASGVPQLESLRPSESGNLTFSVDVKNPATKDSSKQLQVVSNIKIKSNEYETAFPGNQLTMKIGSPMQLTSRVAYVSGSLPPRAGKSTTYKISLSFKNATNDYSNVSVQAFIPLGSGGFDAGSVLPSSESSKVNYDPSTGKLTWNVGSLPAHTGVFSQAKTLEFQVRLSAVSSQVGQSVTLIKDIAVTATDIFTQKEITGSSDNLTTSDLEDNGYGGGTVEE